MFEQLLQAIGVSALALPLLVCMSAGSVAQKRRPTSHVPFVGCRSDGQVGPLAPPKGTAQSIKLFSELADNLAYYKAENGFGILAPRGWYCFSTYGSNGSNLFISPEPINEKELFTPDWRGFSGSAIHVSDSIGDTSGRFAVARTIARVFPDRMEFVRAVIAEGVEPASAFPTGPYTADKLERRGQDVVEFETPAHTEGLGTHSRLAANSSPIRGVTILFGDEPNLVQLSMRLPNRYQSLEQSIIQRLESETRQLHPDNQ